MREIRLARLDKTRPALVLTREAVLSRLAWVTVAPITSTIRGLSSEVLLDPARNGVDHRCVVNCDNINTIAAGDLGRVVGRLMADQEEELTRALMAAFDLG